MKNWDSGPVVMGFKNAALNSYHKIRRWFDPRQGKKVAQCIGRLVATNLQ